MKSILRLTVLLGGLFFLLSTSGCKKDKFTHDAGANIELSQDSILFDTVFTTIGSSTKNFRIRNKNAEKILISSITLEGGSASAFIINVDGLKGTSFSDLELAAGDSMYVFVQVKVDPTNVNSPVIVSDKINFQVNGNTSTMQLEAWGQDAYYHYPDSAIKFKDGSYLAYSLVNSNTKSYTKVGDEYVWKNDKPHVIYGYLVVDEKQKLKVPAGTKVYLNYKAGIWVYAGGQIQVLGQKDNEVLFTAARRDRDYLDEPGQWDRIWINEGSSDNIIDYAIIKNGYIGVQTELIGADSLLATKRKLTLSNTKIQNMSMWGLYSLAYNVVAYNNVISNCQEYSVNILLGGGYAFVHNTFVNFWSKQKARDKATVHVNNNTTEQVYPLYFYFANSAVDGKLSNELSLDIKDDPTYAPSYTISNCWLRTTTATDDVKHFFNNKIAASDAELKYKDIDKYDFSPATGETQIGGFVSTMASTDAVSVPKDITGKARNTVSVTAGAFELP